MTEVQSTGNSNFHRTTELLLIVGGNTNDTPTLEVWQFFIKLNKVLPYSLAITLLGFYLIELKFMST